MKKMLKYLGVVALAAGLFAACEHPDISEIFDDGVMSQDTNIAYMQAPVVTAHSWQYRASSAEDGYTFLSNVNREYLLTMLKIGKPADKDLHVTLEYDMEALEALNASLAGDGEEEIENPKQYKLLDKSTIDMNVVIPKGETEIPVCINMDYSDFFEGERDTNYAVPLRIASIEDGVVSTNLNSFMVTFDTDYITNNFSFSTATQTYALQLFESGEPRTGTNEWELSAYLQSKYEMAENTTVKLRINNSLIASSSTPNDVAATNVKLSKDTFTFGADDMANEPLSLIFSDGMASLKAGNTYQIPIEIETITGHGAAKGQTTVLTCRITTAVYRPKYITFMASEYEWEAKFSNTTGELLNGSTQISTTVGIKSSVAVSAYAYIYYGIDESLVSKYNKEHNTNYTCPEGISVPTSYLYLSNGSSQTGTSYTVKVNFSSMADALTPGKDYVVPIVLTKFTSNDQDITLTDDVCYVVIKTKKVDLPLSQEEAPVGTIIPTTNIKAWTINMNTDPNVKGVDRTASVNGTSTSSYMTINATTSALLIDLGDVYKLSDIEFNTYYSANYSLRVLGLQTSTDGTTWDVWEDSYMPTPAMTQYIKVVNPKEVRYIRFLARNSFTSTTIYVAPNRGGIRFYEQK